MTHPYIKPQIIITAIQQSLSLLAGSPNGLAVTETPADPNKGVLSREFSFDYFETEVETNETTENDDWEEWAEEEFE